MFTTLCNHLEKVDLGDFHMDMKKNCEMASQGGPIAGQILHVSNHKIARLRSIPFHYMTINLSSLCQTTQDPAILICGIQLWVGHTKKIVATFE